VSRSSCCNSASRPFRFRVIEERYQRSDEHEVAVHIAIIG